MIRDPRWLAHDAYFSPGAVAEQHLRGLAILGVDPDVIVDAGSGAGAYLQRAAIVWPRALRVAVEIREEEAEHLRRWAHVVVVDSFDGARTAEALGKLKRRRQLVVGNFPFSLAVPMIRWGRARGGVVSTLLPAGFGDHESAEEVLCDDPPTHALRPTGGRIGFLGDGKDFQHHEALTWLAGPARPWGGWRTLPLPPLPAHLRRWTVRPGTERTFAPLPPAFYPQFGEASHA